MIKLTDIDDRTNWPYLKQNPDFANQLVATLNQVDGLDPNQLVFYADSYYWTYDCWFSPHYESNKETFRISNGRICIRSTNRDDLLNLNYYQHLNHLTNRYPIKKQLSYFPEDQVLQLKNVYWWSHKPHLNIKLSKAIDQYNQNQLNAMGKLMTNVHNLIIKDDELDWKQFDDQWKQEFDLDEVRGVGIVFDLNDFVNPKLLIRWKDENDDNHYENNELKQVLKADSELLKFLNNNNFQSEFQDYQSNKQIFCKS